MKFILGRKLGMSQIFNEDGTVVPVTVIEAEQNTVTQIKTKEKDGYEAVQVKSPKSKVKSRKKEFKNTEEMKVGDKIDVSIFSEGDVVKVSGLSKGKGFAGVMKRHNFSGMPFSHGHHHVTRHGGSIGQRFPQHTLKGMRMAGRMGGIKATTRGLKVVKVDAENNLIAVKGAVPGNKGGLIIIQSQ
ncbi:MAG: 50S ribosomal protein L3 [Candidatus Yanofskybacteria bacterium]|nr:50S ribosomal protein L3 [Candidatus Yanofskybacteria bacterium]